MKMLSLLAVAALVLSGCKSAAVIADINEDKLIIHGDMFTDRSAVMAKAREGCRHYNRRPVSISQYEITTVSPITGYPSSKTAYLFACKPKS